MKALWTLLTAGFFACAPLQGVQYCPCDDDCCCDFPIYFVAGYNCSGIFCRKDDGSFGFAEARFHQGGHALVGYQFNPCWALEAGALYLGETTLNITDLAENGYHKRETVVFPLRAKGSLDLNCCLQVFALFGLHGYYDRFTERLDSSFPPESEQCGIDYNWGFGFQVCLLECLSARLAFSKWHFNHSHTEKTAIEVSAVYSF